MDYESQIKEERLLHEKKIKDLQKASEDETTSFSYFPINKKWRIPAKIQLRKPKKAMDDSKISFHRVGKVSFELEGSQYKFNLYHTKDDFTDGGYYIYIKDGTTGKSSYGVGRFVRVTQDEAGNYFVDFNLSFTPACGHLSASACPWAQESTQVMIEAGEQYFS